MPEPARWYHLQGERQLGPLELDTMRRLVLAGTVDPDTYVWSDGMPEWQRARDVPALVPPESVRAELPGWAAATAATTPADPATGPGGDAAGDQPQAADPAGSPATAGAEPDVTPEDASEPSSDAPSDRSSDAP